MNQRIKFGRHSVSYHTYDAAHEQALRLKAEGAYSITIERIRDTVTGRPSEHGPRFRVEWNQKQD